MSIITNNQILNMSIKGEYQSQFKSSNQYTTYPRNSHLQRSSIYNNSNNNSFLEPSNKQISTSSSIKDINCLAVVNYTGTSSSKNLYTQQANPQLFNRNTQIFDNEREDRISGNNSAKVSRNASLTYLQELQKSSSHFHQNSNQSKYGVLSLKQSNQLQRKVIDITSKIQKMDVLIKRHDRQIVDLWKETKELKQIREQQCNGRNLKSMSSSKVSRIGTDRDKQNLIGSENLLLERNISTIESNISQNLVQSFKRQLQSMKSTLQKHVTREKLHDQFFHMETSIRTAITNMRQTITKQMSQFTQNTLKQRKRDLQKLKGMVTSQVKISEERVKTFASSLQNKLSEIQKKISLGNIQVSTVKYEGKPLYLRLAQSYSISEQSEIESKKPQTPYPKTQNTAKNSLQIPGNKFSQFGQQVQDKQNKDKAKQQVCYKTLSLYKIDKQGYLLDDYSYYLLDSKGNQIRLQAQHLLLLQKTGIYC